MKSADTKHQATEPAQDGPAVVEPVVVEQLALDRPVAGGLAYPAAVQRHAGHDHKGPIGLAGGELDHEAEHTLHRHAGGGAPLSPQVRAPLESAFGADFSTVRLHADGAATDLNRDMSATAFTHGRDIYFRDGLPDTSTHDGLHLLAHELTHTVQQGSVRRTIGRTAAEPPAVQLKAVVGAANDPAEMEAERIADQVVRAIRDGAVDEPVDVHAGADDGIHRHSAYEHYLLGELQPREIAMIPAVREVTDNEKQTDRAIKSMEKGEKLGLDTKPRTDRKARSTVLHLIDREMERLLQYRKDPEALNERMGEKGEVTKGGKGLTDDEYQVPIVVLTCADGKLVVSYSEMNTMPDLFGNPEAIQKTPKANVLALLQGVRQQLYIELSNIREEVFGVSNNELYEDLGVDDDFQGARGPRAQAVNDGAYELRMESQVQTATSRKGEEREQYFAALERNACHFAPASWAQWRGYHDKARALAIQSAKAKADADALAKGPDAQAQTTQVAKLRAAGKNFANDAMIQNSFGEHYLQDSFAAGHLIDKTKIMQWFTQWADKDKGGMGSTASGKAAWTMALHAANSDLKSNPQMLHDKGVRGEFTKEGGGGAEGAASEIGMDVDAGHSQEIVLMMKWRALAQAKPEKRTLTVAQAVTTFGKPADEVTPLLEALVTKKFAEKDEPWRITKALASAVGSSADTKYILKEEMVNVLNQDAKERRGLGGGNVGSKTAYVASRGHGAVDDKGTNTGAISDDEASAAAAEFNLAAYNNMLSNAYVGAATKYFHDKFCKEGLVVVTGDGTDIGRIYGDSNMMNAGAQKGVQYSAETSRMSRDSVFDLISGKPAGQVPTADAIAQRFPVQVLYNGKTPISLAAFNKELEKVIKDETKWLNPASSNKARLGYKLMDGISDKGALDVASLSQDPAHGPF